MSRSTKPRKKYRPKSVRVPAMIGVHNIWLAPLKLLHDIRHAEVWEAKGIIFMPAIDNGCAYNAAETMDLFSHFIREVGVLKGIEIDTSPILRLAARIRADMPIDDGALRPVEELFDLGQRLANHITPNQALEILQSHRGRT